MKSRRKWLGLTGGLLVTTAAHAVDMQPKVAPKGPKVRLDEFGDVGDKANGDDDTFSRAFRHLKDRSGGQGVLQLPRGATYIARPLVVASGVVITGAGPNFSSQIAAAKSFAGNALILISGVKAPGGWVFRCGVRGLTLNATDAAPSIKSCILIESAYSVVLEDVFIYNCTSGGIALSRCNNVSLCRVQIHGAANKIGDVAVRVDACNLVRIDEADLEHFATAVVIGASAVVNMSSPYVERCSQGIVVEGDQSMLAVWGGILRAQQDGFRGLALVKGSGQIAGLCLDSRAGSGGMAVAAPENWHFSGSVELIKNGQGRPLTPEARNSGK